MIKIHEILACKCRNGPKVSYSLHLKKSKEQKSPKTQNLSIILKEIRKSVVTDKQFLYKIYKSQIFLNYFGWYWKLVLFCDTVIL